MLKIMQVSLMAVIAVAFTTAFAEDAVDSAAPKPASYTASLAGGKTLDVKISDFNLYSLLTLSSTASKSDTGSLPIDITVKNGANVVTLTNTPIAFTYKVAVNKKSGAATASGKGTGLALSASNQTNKSSLTLKLDVSAAASKLPQVKGKATLIGTTSFTLSIGSAMFVGTVDAKGKVTF